MKTKVVVEGEANSESKVPACAKAYLLRVLFPQHQHAAYQTRNLVEANVIAHCLDHLAQGRYNQAADILARRFTSIEANMTGIPWEKARFLEIVDMDDNSLIGRTERALVAHESAVEAKLKSSRPTLTPAAAVGGQWQGKGPAKSSWEQKGKGKRDNPFRDQEYDAEMSDPNALKAQSKGKGGKKNWKGKW